jgi:4-hydroxy-3-methylbut-2-enyl diphosphate reductase
VIALINYSITLDRHAGFCFGVDRAVKLCEETADATDSQNVYTYGEIIHNAFTVDKLRKKGVSVIGYEDIDTLTPDDTVIIRSHGVPNDIFTKITEKGAKIIDGTCPFVKKIHNIVSEYSQNGYDIVVFGDKNHAEIIGIVGNCQNTPHIYADITELLDKTDNFKYFFQKKLAFIAQTTYNIIDWENAHSEIIAHINDFCDCKVFNTICDATSKRQQGAIKLSRSCDITVVVGDKNSSNTRKLYDICAREGKDTILTDGINLTEFRRRAASGVSLCLTRQNNTPGKTLTVGITAGASAPREVIEEVYKTMDDTINGMTTEGMADESFEALLNENLNRRVHKGNRVTGIVTGFHINEVTVDLGTKQAGFVPLEEFAELPDEDPKKSVKIGDEVELVVTQVNDAEGWVTLSKSKADAKGGYELLYKALETGEILDAVVTEVVKGGVVVTIKGVRVFVPASHSGIRTPRSESSPTDNENALKVLFKKPVRVKIIEVDEKRGKAVGSIREANSSDRGASKEKFWDAAEIGKKYTGVVRSLTNYGAFVDLGGVDGMVHLSELSWDKVSHPSQIVKVGDSIDVVIKDLDREKNRVSLSYKDPTGDPFTKFLENYEVGMDIPVKIVSVAAFGAFAQIIPGVDGLIHISQLADSHVANAAAVVKKDDEVTARITEIDTERRRISLSIRVLTEGVAEPDAPYEIPEETE